jgi:hypothetical protein
MGGYPAQGGHQHPPPYPQRRLQLPQLLLVLRAVAGSDTGQQRLALTASGPRLLVEGLAVQWVGLGVARLKQLTQLGVGQEGVREAAEALAQR